MASKVLTVSNGAPRIAMSYFSTSAPSFARQCTYGKLAKVVKPANADPLVISMPDWPNTACSAKPEIGGKVISRATTDPDNIKLTPKIKNSAIFVDYFSDGSDTARSVCVRHSSARQFSRIHEFAESAVTGTGSRDTKTLVKAVEVANEEGRREQPRLFQVGPT